ncbi:hypothetical protein QZH41_002376 [Actinostola sp. cb2023]|nr:hypothetical protein QZH41_002376 [Actinostola sp. cb2023]
MESLEFHKGTVSIGEEHENENFNEVEEVFYDKAKDERSTLKNREGEDEIIPKQIEPKKNHNDHHHQVKGMNLAQGMNVVDPHVQNSYTRMTHITPRVLLAQIQEVMAESFTNEWETYGTELPSRYGIEDILFNQSQRAKSLFNQSECLDTVTARTLHGYDDDDVDDDDEKCSSIVVVVVVLEMVLMHADKAAWL